MASDVCGVCGQGKEAHRSMAHEFSLTGQLIERKPLAAPIGASSIDLPLRMVLIDAGIITAQELVLKEAELGNVLSSRRLSQSADD